MSRTTTQRPTRTPVSGTKQVLSVRGKEPGYEYRIVNDRGDRVSQMQEQGYEVVCDKNIKVGDRRIANPTAEGTAVQVSVGQGEKAFLMRIKKEWYDEDQTTKQKEISALEDQIKEQARTEGLNGKLSIS